MENPGALFLLIFFFSISISRLIPGGFPVLIRCCCDFSGEVGASEQSVHVPADKDEQMHDRILKPLQEQVSLPFLFLSTFSFFSVSLVLSLLARLRGRFGCRTGLGGGRYPWAQKRSASGHSREGLTNPVARGAKGEFPRCPNRAQRRECGRTQEWRLRSRVRVCSRDRRRYIVMLGFQKILQNHEPPFKGMLRQTKE